MLKAHLPDPILKKLLEISDKKIGKDSEVQQQDDSYILFYLS